MVINTVINGEYEGKKIINGFGKDVLISTSTFGSIRIDKETTNTIEIISENKNGKDDISYKIKILFISGKESIIYVNKKIYNKLIEIWPEKRKDILKQLLITGYEIIGYTSYFLGSAFGSSSVLGTAMTRMQRQHNILLQKDISIVLITIIEESVNGEMVERERQSMIISPIYCSKQI